jgi:hypothetical protein
MPLDQLSRHATKQVVTIRSIFVWPFFGALFGFFFTVINVQRPCFLGEVGAYLEEIPDHPPLPPPSPVQATIHAEVFEDNNAALLLATNQHLTSRTKYFLVKWHFFWSHVNSGDIKISKIETKKQNADFATKALPREPFEANRLRVQGW